MKKYIIFFLLLMQNILVLGVPAIPDSLWVVQPSGDTLWTYLHGDEFYHWRSTIDGHVIIRDTNNYFRYAIVDVDSLRPSDVIAHNIEDRSLSENDYINSNKEVVDQFIQLQIELAHTYTEADSIQTTNIQRTASDAEEREPIIGKRNVLTILMYFQDYSFTRTREEFDSLMNQKSGYIEYNHGSVWKYYKENSYGKLDVNAVVVGPFQAKHKRSYYESSNTGINVRSLVREAITYAKDIVDCSTLDGNNDGYIDCVHVVFAGEGKSFSDNSYIWEHKGQLYAPIDCDGKKAKWYIITPELYLYGQLAPVGTICHEIGHIFGAPDYYDTNEKNGTFFANGQYDIMGNGSWNGPNYRDGCHPSHHNPYTKCYTFQWDTPKIITKHAIEYKLSSATRNEGHFYRINTSTDDEYLLLENRTQEEFDNYIPNEGLLIYHIHKDLEKQIPKNRVNDIHPLKLYLIDASAGTNPTNDTASYGYRETKRAFPGDEYKKTMFTSTTIPSAKAWDNSAIGVNLYFINQTSSNEITFTVNPKIQGPSQLCGTQDYYVSNHVPYTDIVEWSYSTGIAETSQYPALQFMGGTEGSMVTIKRGNGIYASTGPIFPEDTAMQMAVYGINRPAVPVEVPYVGTAKLYATIKGGNGTYQLEKDIVLPEYVTPSLAPSYTLWPINTERTLSDTSCVNIEPEHIKWYVQYPNSISEYVYTGHDVTLKPTEVGEMTVRIVNDCGCETSNEATYTYTVVNAGPMSYPNPVTTSILPIDIMRYDDAVALYTVELWHQTYGRVRSISTTGNHVELDVSGLPTDWYQLVLLRNWQTLDSGNVLISL